MSPGMFRSRSAKGEAHPEPIERGSSGPARGPVLATTCVARAPTGFGCTEAANGNRTRIIALEGRGSTVELPPRAPIPPVGRFGDDDSLHKPRRTWRSRRTSPPSFASRCPSSRRSAARPGDRTRARPGPLRRSRRRDASERSRAAGTHVRWPASASSVPSSLDTARDSPRSAAVCIPPYKPGSSCPAGPDRDGARRTRRPAWSRRSDCSGGWASRDGTRTYVRIGSRPTQARLRRRIEAPRGVAQSGSAPGWGPGGRRFKSCLPDY